MCILTISVRPASDAFYSCRRAYSAMKRFTVAYIIIFTLVVVSMCLYVNAYFMAPPTFQRTLLLVFLMLLTPVVFILLPVVVVSWIVNLRRRRALMALADKLGLDYADLDFFDLPSRYPFPAFAARTAALKASTVISGPLGPGRVVYFDYGPSSTCAFHLPAAFPRLTLRPEIPDDKLKAALGFPDINLDHAEFNRKFFVKCDDRKFAYAMLHPRAMQFFLDQEPRLSMYMDDDYFILYARRLKPKEVERLILDAAAFADLIPNFLRRSP